MKRDERIDARTLIDEVERYLGVVEAFRAVGCEPTWRPEPGARALEHDNPERSARIEASAH